MVRVTRPKYNNLASTKLEDDMHSELLNVAAKRGMTVSELLRVYIADGLYNEKS